MRLIDTLAIHCLDVRPEWYEGKSLGDKIAEVRRWHKTKKKDGGRGFNDIGYHYIIDRDGKVGRGRDDRVVGAHVYGQNKHSLGIALVGGHGCDANQRFLDNYTPEQEEALLDLIEQLEAEYDIRRIKGHNEFKNVSKACPGFKVKKWLSRKEQEELKPAELQPTVKDSTSLQGNGLNILTGGSLASLGVFYTDLGDVERYVILGVGVVVLLGGLWLFRKKILKIADEHGL